MALLTLPSAACSWVPGVRRLKLSSAPSLRSRYVGGFKVTAFFLDPTREPILKEALKEPVAFVGGVFAGLLRLDLKEEPLREWVARTVEASGLTPEEISKTDVGEKDDEEQAPLQIEIE